MTRPPTLPVPQLYASCTITSEDETDSTKYANSYPQDEVILHGANEMIKVTVVGGECQGGHHRVGDHWEIESLTPEGMCLGAWGAVFPYVMALDLKGEFSWEEVPTKIRIHCPDPVGIILEVEKTEDS